MAKDYSAAHRRFMCERHLLGMVGATLWTDSTADRSNRQVAGAQTSITLRERTTSFAVCATLVLALRPRKLRYHSQGKIVAIATFVAGLEVVSVSRQNRAVGQITE